MTCILVTLFRVFVFLVFEVMDTAVAPWIPLDDVIWRKYWTHPYNKINHEMKKNQVNNSILNGFLLIIEFQKTR